MRTVITHKDPEWHDLIFDATGAKEGQILIGYDIIPLHEREYVSCKCPLSYALVPS